jgi:hypothetical protein
LEDSLSEDLASERDSAVLDPASPAVKLLLEQAHATLLTERRLYRNAAGIVLARDQAHANAIAQLLRFIVGDPSEVEVVTSDEPLALDKIKTFKTARTMWIVAVRMISEGVDIKRASVLVFLTNVESVLFFRQAGGRIGRREKDEPLSRKGHMFMLDREPYRTFVAEFEAEQDSPVPDEEEDDPRSRDKDESGEREERTRPEFIDCDAHIGNTFVTGGAEPINPELRSQAEYLRDILNIPLDYVDIAEALRDSKRPVESPEPPRSAEPKDDRLRRKKAEAQKKAHHLGLLRGYSKDEAAKRIHFEWERMAGHHRHDEIDEPEIDEKVKWLSSEIRRYPKVA